MERNIFLSHNNADKDFVRKLAASLSLVGGNVWFDEWKIRPGDSIPGKINEGLAEFEIFVLVWSKPASESQWVGQELDAAFVRKLSEGPRLIPLVLDKTPLPPLLQATKYLDASDKEYVQITRKLMGIDSDREFRMAVQECLDDLQIEFREFPGVGILVACPKCGAKSTSLHGWQRTDEMRDDVYVGAECEECGWSDGSEV